MGVLSHISLHDTAILYSVCSIYFSLFDSVCGGSGIAEVCASAGDSAEILSEDISRSLRTARGAISREPHAATGDGLRPIIPSLSFLVYFHLFFCYTLCNSSFCSAIASPFLSHRIGERTSIHTRQVTRASSSL